MGSAKKSKKNDWHYFTVKIEPVLGDKPATEITPEEVERLVRPIEVQGFNSGRLTLALLRKLYNWALDPVSASRPGEGALIESNLQNPCRHYRLNPANKPKPSTYPSGVVVKLARIIPTPTRTPPRVATIRGPSRS